MALGGGTFTQMDKTLPGAYINSVSAARNLSLFGNGVVAIGLEYDFGNQGEVLEILPGDFSEDSLVLLGYSKYDDKLKGIRELFENSKKVYFCVLNKTVKAENKYATANKGGTRGNDIIIKIQTNIDEPSKKDVITMLDYEVVDKQTVTKASELRPNALVTFKDQSLQDTAGEHLSSGSNGNVQTQDHHDFLKKLETLNINALACMSTEKAVQKLYVEYTKRLRDDIGVKFGTIMCEASDLGGEDIYNYEGVVVVVNTVKDGKKGNELVPYTSAIYASADLGKSNLNKKYTGDYEILSDYTQYQLKQFIKKGRFAYHKVGNDFRVLDDVNSLVTETEAKNSDFKDNQVIRVLDALAIADAKVFNEIYLGKVNIDTAGIESYQNRLIDVRERFLAEHALKAYDKEAIKVEEVEGKRGAVKVNSAVTPAECFRQVYITNYVK